MNVKPKGIFNLLLWFIEGIIVGFGAIMPGLSGGTLCVAFGMYLPIIEIVSKPKETIRKNGKMLTAFAVGAVVGFVGLSGVTAWVMNKSNVLVTCLFIGLIIGMFPQLWKDAGIEGRNKNSYISIVAGFFIMLILMMALHNNTHLKVEENFLGFLLCGILWGLSFIVPGLSSSTLLLFFGLYQSMLDGISNFDFNVLVPLAFGMIACVGILSNFINKAFKNYYNVISHAIIGIVTATVIMILPDCEIKEVAFIWKIICIISGTLVSYILTVVCDKIKSREC